MRGRDPSPDLLCGNSEQPSPTRGEGTSAASADAGNGSSVANKVSRGTFSATFVLAALIAIGAEIVRLEDI
jgi:uncharacterized protein DUF6471